MLDIVYRSCDHSEVHPERGPRFIDVDKKTLIKKCFTSLIDSIAIAKEKDIMLWILDDHSSEETLEFFHSQCTKRNISYHVVNLEESGFNYSALKQFEFCRDKGRKWVYSVEDDYLHFPEAIDILVQQANEFEKNFGVNFTIRPDDDQFTYSSNTKYSNSPCRLMIGLDRHWRTLYNTHNTLFTHVDIIKEYWELFASLAKFFRRTNVNEDGTINTIWTDGVSKPGPVLLLSPIPTLTIHVSQGNEPSTVNYKKLWESIEYE